MLHTDDSQTTDGRTIANSERSLKKQCWLARLME